MGAALQIAAYLLAILLPLAIFVALVAGFGWAVAVAAFLIPTVGLALFGLSRSLT